MRDQSAAESAARLRTSERTWQTYDRAREEKKRERERETERERERERERRQREEKR
jgi:hypothetical protein